VSFRELLAQHWLLDQSLELLLLGHFQIGRADEMRSDGHAFGGWLESVCKSVAHPSGMLIAGRFL
jgi:hypothetical protein